MCELGSEAWVPLDPLLKPSRLSGAVFDLVSPYSIVTRMKADAR